MAPWILPRTGQPKMGEDPLNHGRVVDRGDQLHPPGAARTARDVALTLERLPFAGPVRVRHWRIDSRHSNSHTAWQWLGRPQDPSEGQLRAIKERQSLEMLEPESEVAVPGARVTLTVALPLRSVLLLEIRSAR